MAVAPSKTPTLMEPIASKMLFPVTQEAYVAIAVSTQDHVSMTQVVNKVLCALP